MKKNNLNEDILDKNFVKMQAKYVDFKEQSQIYGTLLMTIDTICFDAQKSRSSITDNQLISSAGLLNHNTSALTIHIPLEAVTSFNTHTDLKKLLQKKRAQKSCFTSFSRIPTRKSAPGKISPPDWESIPSSSLLYGENEERIYFAVSTTPIQPIIFPRTPKPKEVRRLSLTQEEEKTHTHDDLEHETQEFFVFNCPMNRFDELCSFMLKARNPDQEKCASLLKSGLLCLLYYHNVSQLSVHMPLHWAGCNLRTVYKSERDGYSLATIYRKAQDIQNAMCLLLKDTSGASFGAIMSEQMHCSHHFYGTGESCVFTWHPCFKVSLPKSTLFILHKLHCGPEFIHFSHTNRCTNGPRRTTSSCEVLPTAFRLAHRG
ncbi:hypothetical protein Ciccas_008081 [Cichlidogyrus casuarinus]|uniref:Oxidation resistance protein 1 n=1 Tax=Cichlidogyrus casuarinus TaxID=1844966 RepID=A0ABD2Q106_9PLAT